MDNAGDVLLAGPAIRAVAVRAGAVTLLCGSRGRAAAELLPGVSEIVEWTAPWIDPEPEPVGVTSVLSLVSMLRNRFAEAAILTSFHQSPLPLALLLRMAGIQRIAAISDDYPGALLDIRHSPQRAMHEVERSLELVGRLGHRLAEGDRGDLRLRRPARGFAVPQQPYVVVHPGASVPARSLTTQQWRAVSSALSLSGHALVVTGGPDERPLTATVAGAAPGCVTDLGGATSLAELTEVIAHASAIVVGNTGPAHVAAAVGTPVVSLFAPTVPAERWRPWAVPHVLLGDQRIGCAGCRSRTCPVPGHPCLSGVEPAQVVAAVDGLVRSADRLEAAV
ncbi:MAG: glycosyltransferase family 9 protein [Gaiellales bacterium]